jgi:hypothetical protein
MEEQSGTPRRTVFRRLDHHEEEPLMTSSEHRISASLRRSIDGQLEEGLRALEEQATDLMREIAAEIWRASGTDMRPEQERIVSLLSRDHAIKGLIASNDERFQALSLRSARVEDSMNQVAETGRTSRDAIEASLLAIREIADSPTLQGVEAVRTQLEQVEHHIAAALATMQDRDRAIVETVTRQVQAHGQLLTEETAKVIGAIDAYVQTGAEAMGTLSQRVEEHAEAFAVHDGTISQTVADRVGAELAPVAQQLDMLAEQVGMHGRDQAQVRSEIERLLEARIMGVAQLVRADSEALRALIEERTDVQVDTIRETVDWRMAAFAERMDEKLGSVAGDVAVTVTESVNETVASTVSATVSETVAAAVSGTVADALADTVAGRAAEAAEMAIASSLGATVERMNAGVGAIDGIDAMLAEGQAAVEERLRAHIDDRMTAIARLIRSDNQALASTVREQQTIVPSETLDAELVRQTLRAIKELQAGLADDVQSNVDVQIRSISDQLHKETQSTTESMVKVAEVLGEKIDRLTVRVDEGVGNDMQVVIDRMSDAIQAMSSARRSA